MVLLSEKCRRRTVLPHCTVFPRQRGRGAGGGTSQLYTLKLYTHARTYFVQIPFETRRQRREREWKRCDERAAKEKTGLRKEKYRGGDAEQRKREREIERESILCVADALPFFRIVGRTGNPFRRPPYRPSTTTPGRVLGPPFTRDSVCLTPLYTRSPYMELTHRPRLEQRCGAHCRSRTI